MSEPLDIYEGCQQIRRTMRPDVLDDILEITFTHIPTRRMLKRMRFHIWADKGAAAWIRAHPTFKRGCWPVGLYNLHDWMWEVKFVEVDGQKVIEGGSVDPKVGTTYIRAEFENFEDGVWFAPLVNIANTHIYDQLSQFYKDSPNAKTDPSRIPQILSTEKEKIEAKQRATAVAQMQRRHLLKEPTKTVKVLIDESGDVGFQRLHDVYVFAPVIVPENKIQQVNSLLDALRAKHWSANAPSEIHMTQVPEAKRAAIREDFARIIRENDITILGCLVEKEAFIKHLFRCHASARRAEENPLDLTWNDLINDRSYFLQANTLATTVEIVVSHLALDFLTSGTAAVFTHDRKHREWMNTALALGFSRGLETAKKLAEAHFGISTAPPASFSVADSKTEPCLWLSDWISGELRAWSFNKPFSPELESIKPNMTFLGFRNDGVKCSSRDVGVAAETKFPDLPRLLARGDPTKAEEPPENSSADMPQVTEP